MEFFLLPLPELAAWEPMLPRACTLGYVLWRRAGGKNPSGTEDSYPKRVLLIVLIAGSPIQLDSEVSRLVSDLSTYGGHQCIEVVDFRFRY